VAAASGAGQLASGCLAAMAAPLWPPPGEAAAPLLVDAGLDLVVGALRAAAGGRDVAGLRQRAMLGELKSYALAHLGDPGLTPGRVARAHYISARQLHRLFARDGRTFGAWAREQRLRRCRDELADPAAADRTIAEVAARWGYRSAAHFTRAFAARFGTTPRDFRAGQSGGVSRRPDRA
jgi:AraC-like DNA-binding protein